MVPVVVTPPRHEPYTAAAKLQLQPDQDPPYAIVQLYDDPPAVNENQNRSSLREIELDLRGGY